MIKMTTEVIIPVYNPGKTFGLLLRKLFEQSVVPDAVRIINTNTKKCSVKDIEKIVNEAIDKSRFYSDIKISIDGISKSSFNHGGTRDKGIRQSDADIVIFMTQDAIPGDKFVIKELLESFEDTDVAVAYARQLPRESSGTAQSYINLFNYPKNSCKKTKEDIERLGVKAYFCSDVCAAYRKDIYISIGGFEKNIIFGEDTVYAAKAIEAGYAVYYAADAQVIHSHKYSCMQQFRRNFDIAVMHTDYPEYFKKVSSEKEGAKLVKNTFLFLTGRRAYFEAADFVVQSGFKYAGYLLGKNYKKLSKEAIMYMTSNKDYWKGKV